jgi:hypothetical protein
MSFSINEKGGEEAIGWDHCPHHHESLDLDSCKYLDPTTMLGYGVGGYGGFQNSVLDSRRSIP